MNMATLPQLIEDDIQRLDEALRESSLRRCHAALGHRQGGFSSRIRAIRSDFDLPPSPPLSSARS